MNTLNIPMIMWHLKSARNVVLHDTRIKILLIFLFVLNLVISIWSSNQLLQHLHQWQVQGPNVVTMGLWSLCLLTWSGMGAVSILGVQRAVSSDEAVLLFTLPIPPAARFRTVFALFFIQKWYVLLLQFCMLGYALLSALGWQALSWLALLELGVIVTVLCALLMTLLVMRYLLPRGQMKVRIGVALAGGIIAFLIVIAHPLVASRWQAGLSELRPEAGIILFGLLLFGALGLLAGKIDSLYSATFTTLQGWDRSRRALVLPGMQALGSIFARRSGLTAALFTRAIANQSRSLIFWLRLAIILGIFVFPLVHAAIAPFGFANTLQVVIYAAGLALVQIMEQGPASISGEGNRLAIYLTAPYTFAHILRAKLAVLLLPILGEGLAAGIFLSWKLGLTLVQLGYVIVAIALMIISCITILVLGSIWDEDLNLTVEGVMQTLLQEEVPMTPRRMALFNLCLFCFALMFLVLWKLPLLVALLVLAVFTVFLVMGMGRFSCVYLYKLVQG